VFSAPEVRGKTCLIVLVTALALRQVAVVIGESFDALQQNPQSPFMTSTPQWPADDRALYRINPFSSAKEKNVAETEVIDLFLHAT